MPKPLEKPYFAIREPQNVGSRPTREEIELRAYQIYVDRGGTDGHDVEDWMQAERELLTIEAKRERIGKMAAA